MTGLSCFSGLAAVGSGVSSSDGCMGSDGCVLVGRSLLGRKHRYRVFDQSVRPRGLRAYKEVVRV